MTQRHFPVVTGPREGPSENGASPSCPEAAPPYLLKLANGSRAAGGVLAHTHGGIALVQLTHLAMFAVMVLAGVWGTEHSVTSPGWHVLPHHTDGSLGLAASGCTPLSEPEFWATLILHTEPRGLGEQFS